MFDLSDVKRACEGRWLDILSRCGVPRDLLDGKNHPCPKCGGTDRFRLLDEHDGAVFCNQCFNKSNGDGIAAVMWLTGCSFPDAVRAIEDDLGLGRREHKPDLIDEMAWRKRVGADAFRDFGSNLAQRGTTPVCRVPMFDADMHKVGDFDMSPENEKLQKGMMTQGSKHGMFVAKQPEQGDMVAVVEGVKDAAALHELGFKAVGLPTCRMDASFARMFRGCDVVIVPDRDKAGLEGARETASRLYGVAATIKVAELPADYKETGGADVRDVLRMKDGEWKVRDAITHAKTWSPILSAVEKRPIVFVNLQEAVVEFIQQESQKDKLLPLGLPDVDKALGGGVLQGEMVIVAGRPSHGKTVAAMQALESLATVTPGLMLSEEMSTPALAQRTICGFTAIQQDDWQTQRDIVMRDAEHHFERMHPILVCESSGTVERAIEAIEKAKSEYGIGAVAVDYVQLLKGKGVGRYEQVSDTSTKLKQAAIRNAVVILAVCQLNRSVESNQRKSTSPRMSDLRDSGQLEQDADVILFVEWLHRTSPQSHKPDEYRITVGKNRNRPIVQSIIDCVFIPERQKIVAKAYSRQCADYDNHDESLDAYDGRNNPEEF